MIDSVSKAILFFGATWQNVESVRDRLLFLTMSRCLTHSLAWVGTSRRRFSL